MLESFLREKYKQIPQTTPDTRPTHIEPVMSRELKYQP